MQALREMKKAAEELYELTQKRGQAKDAREEIKRIRKILEQINPKVDGNPSDDVMTYNDVLEIIKKITSKNTDITKLANKGSTSELLKETKNLQALFDDIRADDINITGERSFHAAEALVKVLQINANLNPTNEGITKKLSVMQEKIRTYSASHSAPISLFPEKEPVAIDKPNPTEPSSEIPRPVTPISPPEPPQPNLVTKERDLKIKAAQEFREKINGIITSVLTPYQELPENQEPPEPVKAYISALEGIIENLNLLLEGEISNERFIKDFIHDAKRFEALTTSPPSLQTGSEQLQENLKVSWYNIKVGFARFLSVVNPSMFMDWFNKVKDNPPQLTQKETEELKEAKAWLKTVQVHTNTDDRIATPTPPTSGDIQGQPTEEGPQDLMGSHRMNH